MNIESSMGAGKKNRYRLTDKRSSRILATHYTDDVKNRDVWDEYREGEREGGSRERERAKST